jgi:tetratricopeptide (TPR) repeat protein
VGIATGLSNLEVNAIRAELDRVLCSPEFRGSERRRTLLTFLVEKALAGERVKEYVIGVEAFGKDPDYDPRVDPVVRVEMGRLRLRLADYYAAQGVSDPLRIEIPKGSYLPVFVPQAQGAPAEIVAKPRSLVFVAAAVCVLCAIAIGYRFLPLKRRASAGSPEVRALCTKARFFWSKRTPESLRTSLQLYQQAVRLEPLYAPAYAGQAMCYAVMASNSEVSPDHAADSAAEAAREAIALDPDVADAHAALGLIAYSIDSDWKRADAELSRAASLDPNSATAHQWRALSLLYQGRVGEASPEMQKALALDPISMPLNVADGMLSYYCRHFEEAVFKARKMVEMDPSFREVHLMLGLALEAKRNWADAEREFNLVALASNGDSEGSAHLAHLYALSGRSARAHKTLQQLLSPTPDQYVDPYQLAFIYTALGQKREAFEWLEKAIRKRTAIIMKVDPYMDPLRSDPQFDRLLDLAHLPPS